MSSTALATILHISDLHLGHIIGGPGVSPNDARVRGFIKLYRRFDGLLGHHFDALRALEDFHRRLRPHHPLLIVTGDLTRNGHDLQYDLAKDFLGGRLPPPHGNQTGLNHTRWSECTITGNHDHWPGSDRILGAPRNNFVQLYASPVFRTSTKLPSGRYLQFACISTDSKVNPHSPTRFLARGNFDDQLLTIQKHLKDDVRAIRILLMHHSPSYVNGGLRESEVVHGSDAMLRGILHEKKIRVILSGHIHKPAVTVHQVTTSQGGYPVLEARCGTTCVRDTYPKTWSKKFRGRRLEANSLMVHKVTDENGRLYWNTQIFEKPIGGMYPDPTGASQPYVHRFPL